jgi:hypothetical protein
LTLEQIRLNYRSMLCTVVRAFHGSGALAFGNAPYDVAAIQIYDDIFCVGSKSYEYLKYEDLKQK